MHYFIDTHAHLYLPEFDPDREKVIETAVHRGVKKILLPNINVSTIGPMNNLASRFPGVCYPMMGLHPTSVKDDFRDELEKVGSELKQGGYCGIGETGIDLYWDKSYIKEQCVAFSEHLDWSLAYGLPVIIHARGSFGEIMEILQGYRNKGLKGIFHAFTGSVQMAQQAIEMGFKLGIGGIVTYKNADLPEIVRETALNDLVLETDSPYLTPVPFRGKRNESSYIPFIAEAVKQIKNISLDEVAKTTTSTVIELFNLDHARI